MYQQSGIVFMIELSLLSEEELTVARRKTQEISCQDDEPEELYGAWI